MSVTAMPLRPVGRTGIVLLAVGLVLGIGGAVWAAAEGTSNESVYLSQSDADFLAWSGRQDGVETLTGGTQMKVLQAGEGPSPQPTDLLEIGYKGSLKDGKVFDENEKVPFPASGAIPGFDKAMARMQVGGRYRIWIPSDEGYGPRGSPPVIPPDSMLIFDVTLHSINNPELIAQMQMMQQLQAMQQGHAQAGGESPPPGR